MQLSRVTFVGLAFLLLASTTRTEEATLGSTALSWDEIQAKVRPNGTSWQVVKAPTATLAELESHVSALEPGKAPHPPHRHANEEIFILREGTMEVTIEGVSKRIGPGGFVYIAPNELHGWKNVGDTKAVYFVIAWKPRSN